jgi:adenine-specific DNA-methyltransferase
VAKSANGTGGRGSKRTKAADTAAAEGLSMTADYRHDSAKRKNLPGAAMAGEGEVPRKGRVRYAYSPHLDPVLRFDPTGRADKVAQIVEKACRGERLDAAEQEILRAVGKNWEQPWLEWANKQEEHARGHFSVDPVALHIHERISAQAILRAAQREDTERSLFASPEQSYSESLKFYKHDVDWANRLILGDSLQVMSSLAHRENLAGKVQMIYIDPPYGIKFASNFQPEVGKRDVKDGKAEDLTREPETVRAFRDTWHLGTSSYLGYLHARLTAARHLLAKTGSVFVQISDENLHRVLLLMDDVFGAANRLGVIGFRTTTGKASAALDSTFDYVIWYAREASDAHYKPLFEHRGFEDDENLRWLQRDNGELLRFSSSVAIQAELDSGNLGHVFRPNPLTSQSGGATTQFSQASHGRAFRPSSGGWKTNAAGMSRLCSAGRLLPIGNTLSFIRPLSDFPFKPSNNIWNDTRQSGFGEPKMYVVQTALRVIERCLLMTTDPGDLVLDPTCGSGTTAFVAEKWGRRWITIDTSRVALSIARQRLLTAKFDHYRTAAGPQGALGAENPGSGFKYKTVPHITLGAIAQNTNLDPIFAKHEPILAAKLKAANDALAAVPAALRATLKAKLDEKQKSEGKKSITDADRRRWILPPDNRDPKEKWMVDAKFVGWYDWEVPFDTDSAWPKPLQEAVAAYRAAWRAKMDEVNACIAANADQEELVDQPEVVKGVVRVSGPFTVEGVIPEELTLGEDGTVTDHTPNEFEADTAHDDEAKRDADRTRQQNAIAYIQRMIEKLRADGVTFPNNRRMQFAKVESLVDGGEMSGVHARAVEAGKEDATVGIIFGPEFGPVTAQQIEAAVRRAKYYDDIIIAGFAFAPEATAEVENIGSSKSTKARLHLAHMRPELNSTMDALLKQDTKGSNQQLFTVFGLPAVTVDAVGEDGGDGEYTATLEGVDIFNPVEGTVTSTKGEKVSAWFLDSDYDGRCFCACQAFFPNQDAWEKIAKALGTSADPEAFEAFKGRTSLPFRTGTHGRIAVKAIDARGNEVMTVKALPTARGKGG